MPEPADAVAEAALSVSGVVRLHSGPFGEVSTYLAGRRVDGVRLRSDHTEVHVVLATTVDLLQTAEEVRAAVSAVSPGRVEVYVDDLDDPDRSGPESATD